MIKVRELAAEIREINKANGWNVTVPEDWGSSPHKIPAILALIHSEISEASEAFDFLKGSDFLEELADTAIRILDCIGAWPMDRFEKLLKGPPFDPPGETYAASFGAEAFTAAFHHALLNLHFEISEALEAFRKGPFEHFEERLARAFKLTLQIADGYAGFGAFETAIQSKLAKNRLRGHRHGGKRV